MAADPESFAAPAHSFRYLLRVRYGECDAQAIVFNARWGDYTDAAVTEYLRVLWHPIDGYPHGLDFRLVRQVTEWKSPARFDDVLEARVETARIGTTSFTIATQWRRWRQEPLLVHVETVYVVVDPALGTKGPVPDAHRRALEHGAPGQIVDHAGARRAGAP